MHQSPECGLLALLPNHAHITNPPDGRQSLLRINDRGPMTPSNRKVPCVRSILPTKSISMRVMVLSAGAPWGTFAMADPKRPISLTSGASCTVSTAERSTVSMAVAEMPTANQSDPCAGVMYVDKRNLSNVSMGRIGLPFSTLTSSGKPSSSATPGSRSCDPYPNPPVMPVIST